MGLVKTDILIYVRSGFFNCTFYYFLICILHYLDGNPEKIKSATLLFVIYTPVVLLIMTFLERRKAEEGILLSKEKMSITFNKEKRIDLRWDNLCVGEIKIRFFPTFVKKFELTSVHGQSQRYTFALPSWRRKSLVQLVKANVPQSHDFYKRIREAYPKDFL